jgi:hypothetical protein
MLATDFIEGVLEEMHITGVEIMKASLNFL